MTTNERFILVGGSGSFGLKGRMEGIDKIGSEENVIMLIIKFMVAENFTLHFDDITPSFQGAVLQLH